MIALKVPQGGTGAITLTGFVYGNGPNAMTAEVFPTVAPTTAIPAGGNNAIGFKATSTANFGVFFGSGAPTLIAAKGSLYLRSDGSGVANRAYIATDSAGAWTSIATVT